VYTTLLALTLLAISVGCLFLYLELQKYQGKTSPTGWRQTLEPSNTVLAACDGCVSVGRAS